jgi:hypothetical protein
MKTIWGVRTWVSKAKLSFSVRQCQRFEEHCFSKDFETVARGLTRSLIFQPHIDAGAVGGEALDGGEEADVFGGFL